MRLPAVNSLAFCQISFIVVMARLLTVSVLGTDKILIPSVYWEKSACAHSLYQVPSPLKGPGDEVSTPHTHYLPPTYTNMYTPS